VLTVPGQRCALAYGLKPRLGPGVRAPHVRV